MEFTLQTISKMDILVLGTALWESIEKYGKNNFKMERLEFFDNRQALSSREAQIVNPELLKDTLCLNRRPGGDSDWSSENRRKGWEALNDYLNKNPHKRFRPNGQEVSERNKRLFAEGKLKPYDWTGKKLSEEHKKNISLANKGKNGAKNSMFEKRWVIHPDELIPKLIDICKLENYLNQGYCQGKKIKIKKPKMEFNPVDVVDASKNENYTMINKFTGKLIRKETINWPPVEEMRKLVWEMSMLQLSKIIGCHDESIKNYCVKYDIELPPKNHFLFKKNRKK